jgi:hypothetical protein
LVVRRCHVADLEDEGPQRQQHTSRATVSR